MSDKKKPTPQFIVVRNDIDTDRIASEHYDFGLAEQSATQIVRLNPGASAHIYERKVTFTSSIVVDDDRPKALPR